MSALLSPVQDGQIWRVKIVWSGRAPFWEIYFRARCDWLDRCPPSTDKARRHVGL